MKIVLLFSIIFFVIFGASLVSAEEINDDFWNNWFDPAELNLFPTLPIAVPFSSDPKCQEDSRKLILNLKNQTFWATQMWDSSATASFGVLHGNKYQMGNYDECMAVKEPIKTQFCGAIIQATPHSEDAFKGHPYDLDPVPHATVWKKIQDSRRDNFKNPRDIIAYGLCLPRSCPPLEIEKSINLYLKNINEKALILNKTTYDVEIRLCSDNEEEPFSYGEICFWAFSTFLILIVLIATLLDFIKKKDVAIEKWLGYKMLMSFSLKQNVPKLFSVSDGSDEKYLQIMHGIKCVSIILIVLDHHILLFIASALFNIQKIEELMYFSYQKYFMPHGDLLVDTFFFISGFLVTYQALRFTEKRKVNLYLGIFQRIIRLAPLYFYIIWFQATAIHRFGSGPGWKYRQQEESTFCQKNFWANMLFIQNYVNFKEMCFIHAWYIPCDFHFLILAITLLTIIKKNEKVGVSILYVLTVIAFIIPGIVTYFYKIQPLMLFTPEFLEKPRLDPSFGQLYIKSHTRATVYLIAMLTGYYFYKHKDSDRKFTRFQSVLFSGFGLLLLFTPMAYGSLYFQLGRQYNLMESVIFSMLRRTVWGIGWVFIFISMKYGVIPLFGKILRLKIFQILSKLVYGVYLVHFVDQIGAESVAQIPKHYMTFSVVIHGLTDYIVANVYAGFLYLLLELPFKNLIVMLMFPSLPKTEEKRNQQNNNSNQISIKPDLESGRIYTVKL